MPILDSFQLEPLDHKLYYYYCHFDGHWENKTWQNDKITKQSEEYFFHQRCKKTATVMLCTVMASWFWLAAYIIRLLDSHFTLVCFSRLKYIAKFSILACKMSHNARQSDNKMCFVGYTWANGENSIKISTQNHLFVQLRRLCKICFACKIWKQKSKDAMNKSWI